MRNKLAQLLHRIGAKLGGLHYLHRGIVLTFDIICSLLAGGAAFVFLELIKSHPNFWQNFICFNLIILLTSITVFLLFRFYKVIIRHSNLQNLPRIIAAISLIAVIASTLSDIFIFDNLKRSILGGIFFFTLACTLIIGGRTMMICVYYYAIKLLQHKNKECLKVFIYGETDDCIGLSNFLNSSYQGKYCSTALINPNRENHNLSVQGLQIYGKHDLNRLEQDILNKVPDAILFSSHQSLQKEKNRIVEWCNKAGVQLLLTPPLDKYLPKASFNINPVQIEDLLERPEIKIDEERISHEIAGQTVLVTGAAGSIGSELVRQLCRFSPAKIILLDCAETPLHLIRLEIEEEHPDVPIAPILADVRNKQRCNDIMVEHCPSIIFHAAAYKHVPLMEENPCEAVITNIMGAINMAQLAQEHGTEKFVMISTDKAVNPTNVMGATKRAAEMYIQSLDSNLKHAPSFKSQYITTRFGNVLGSNGSVVPRFREQIAKGGPVTVTHPDIIRYFMTITEACRLVLQAGVMGHGGEIFVFDMGEPVKIDHLARRMIQLSGFRPNEDIKIEYTGLRPGEKLYEEVLSSVESTTETSHNKIRIAHALDNTFEDIRQQTDKLINSAEDLQLEQTLILLKGLVPEFKSQNSPFMKFDR